jgi:hypothetical protein
MDADDDWSGTARLVYAGYLALQAFAGVVLWILLASTNLVRDLFELVPERPEVTDAFVFADLFLGVLGSALSAWALWRERRWASHVLAFTTGALLYPTCYLVIWVAMAGTGSVALAVMVVVSLLNGWIWAHVAFADR